MQHRTGVRRQAGFTLLELLVVVAVLGVLSGVVVFAVGQLSRDAQTAACDAEARTITVAQQAYEVRTGAYGDLDQLVGAGLLSERPDLHEVALVLGDWQLIALGPCAEVAAPGTGDPPADDDVDAGGDLGEPVAEESDCAVGQVDINRATPTELTAIIHIGVVRAAEIPSLRPFGSVEELTRVNGIGPARLADILAQGTACI